MRFLPSGPDDPMPAAPERRSSVRVPVRLNATLDDGRMPRMYETQNLSNSGMLVRTPKPLPVGTRVAVQFLFPGARDIERITLPGGYGFVEGEAIVVRHTHPVKETIRGMALHFTEIESRGKSLLAEFLGGLQGGSSIESPA